MARSEMAVPSFYSEASAVVCGSSRVGRDVRTPMYLKKNGLGLLALSLCYAYPGFLFAGEAEFRQGLRPI